MSVRSFGRWRWIRIWRESTHEALKRALQRRFGSDADEVIPFIANLMGLALDEKERERIAGIEGEAMEKLILKNMSQLIPRIATEAPLVLVFEDFHWADGSSVNLLAPLLRLAENHPILYVLTMRPGFAPSDSFREGSRATTPSTVIRSR